MTKVGLFGVASGLLLGVQSPTLPQNYTFTATSNMMGPMTITVNRSGSKELMEIASASSGLRLRQLYDFQAHRVYTVDLNVNRCTTQEYVSAYAPTMHDPIGGAEEMIRQTKALPTIRRETVNGIGARVVEVALSGAQGKYRMWLAEEFGFPVKQTMAMGSGPERLLFEIQRISYAAPAAALFAAPTECTRIGGVTNANGGSAEMNVDVTVQAQRGVTVEPQAGGAGTRAGKQAAQAGDPERLIGKWDFSGKDGAGVQWRGTLTIVKLEPNSFDASKYSNVCDLDLSSANAGRGVSGPCLYDPQRKMFSLAGGEDSHKYSFTAVLSPDGRSLTRGRWVEASKGNGVWTATPKASGQVKR